MTKAVRAYFYGGWGPQVGEVTHLGGVTACPYNLSFCFDHVYMMGGETHHMLPHLSGAPHLHVYRP